MNNNANLLFCIRIVALETKKAFPLSEMNKKPIEMIILL